MSKRIKNISWLIALFLTTFIGDRTLGWALKKRAETAPFRYSKLYYTDSIYQVVVIGNSRGNAFHAPEMVPIIKKSVLNLSYDALPADLAACLAMDYLEHHKPPDVLIVEITNGNNFWVNLKPFFKSYIGESERLDSLIRKIQLDDDPFFGLKTATGARLSWLFRYNSLFLTRFLKHSPDPNDDEWTGTTVMDSSMITRTGLWGGAPKTEQVAALVKLVRFARLKNVKIRLLILPFFPEFADAIRPTFLAPLTQQIEQQTDIKVDDFSTMFSDINLFANPPHLNRNGALKMMDSLNKVHYFE
jgi:hypothetical protein